MDVIDIKKVNFNREPLLDFDGFSNTRFYEEGESLAQNIRNIILTEKGTYPNTPDFGVGINRYLFEILDGNTISRISSEINDQISKFIVSDSVEINVIVERINENREDLNALAISVTLTNSRILTGSTTSEEEMKDNTLELNYVFAANRSNRRSISKIII